jgi:membrane-bound ClpP family serine protease
MESAAAFFTGPIVATLLLIIGIVGIALELMFLNYGLFALAGIAGFGVYFAAQYVAGYAQNGDLYLFGFGIILLILELLITSFGILGVIGALCLFTSVVMASPNPGQAVVSLIVALVAAIIIIVLAFKYFGNRGTWNRFILRDRLTTEEGYVSNPEQSHLLGLKGTAITPLRPAGTALINGKRIDVVTQGEFIASGQAIEVTWIEGVRVVVREPLSNN